MARRVDLLAGVLGVTAALGGTALPPCAGAACGACLSCVGAGAAAATLLALGAAASTLRRRSAAPSSAQRMGTRRPGAAGAEEADRRAEGGGKGRET